MKKFWIMTWEMAVSEFRLKDQGTFLGFLWTLLHPLIYFLVLYSLFVKWMGHHIPDFPLYLIIGIVQWNFFASGTTNSINVIFKYATLIKSINFPKSILVMAAVLATLFSHLLELLILIVFLFIIKGTIHLAVIGLIPVLLLNVYLVTALSFILATIGVYFLDISRIWTIGMNVGLFLTPIFYSLDIIDPAKKRIILLNPMTHIIQASRDMLIGNTFPDLLGLLYVFVFATILGTGGYLIFKRHACYFAEKI